MSIKTKAGIDRANLSREPDEEHTHAVHFIRGGDTCVGYFQHPAPGWDVAAEHFRSRGLDPGTVERLWATRERWRAISDEVYAEEIAAREAQTAVDQADARAVGRLWMQSLGLDPQSAADRGRMRNFLRWVNSSELFNGPTT